MSDLSNKYFCRRCDNALPLELTGSNIICKSCHLEHSVDGIMDIEVHSSVVFNKLDAYEEEDIVDAPEGPMCDRKCSQCDHEGMTYTARQLRGADEGQTIFYLCLN